MAELRIDGRMTVAAFVEQFENQFAGVLKVYKDNKGHLAEDNARLANVQVLRAPTVGVFSFRSDISVGSFCDRLYEEYGLVVKVFQRSGNGSMLDKMALSDLEKVPYKASKKEMEQYARYMAKEIQDLDLKSAADELCEKGKKVRNTNDRKDLEDIVTFLDELEESKHRGGLDKVASVCKKYPIPEIGGIISSIVSGNFLALGVETLRTLIKLTELFNQ
ncbi:MAG: hypothetical protein J6T87_00385 [Bacteroidales bacterium]|nr:hypothetical protein [Bacteroidales bacterium]